MFGRILSLIEFSIKSSMTSCSQATPIGTSNGRFPSPKYFRGCTLALWSPKHAAILPPYGLHTVARPRNMGKRAGLASSSNHVRRVPATLLDVAKCRRLYRRALFSSDTKFLGYAVIWHESNGSLHDPLRCRCLNLQWYREVTPSAIWLVEKFDATSNVEGPTRQLIGFCGS